MKHVGQMGRRAFLGLGVGARVSGCPNIGKGASGDYSVVMLGDVHFDSVDPQKYHKTVVPRVAQELRRYALKDA